VLVAGDLVTTGGMDAANHALARYLACAGREVHLVAHRVAEELAGMAGVRVHRVPRPLGSHGLGAPLLDRAGGRLARRLAPLRPLVVGNGGNCAAAGAVWLHYVHAAYAPRSAGAPPRRLLARLARRRALRDERRAVARARIVVANSHRTAEHARALLGARPEGVRVVHYGAAPERFRPPAPAERRAARRRLGWDDGIAGVVFVGALGDRRKGFDTLMRAWLLLEARGGWSARMAVAGTGAELAAWRRRVADAGLRDRVELRGFDPDVRSLLWAADLVVAPSRYEAYGLAVHEALCCGVPAVVSADAGVVERCRPELAPLLLRDPGDPGELAGRLEAWRADPDAHRRAAAVVGERLRLRSWDDMAAEMLTLLEGGA
jgi:glycosyltransferase involved in cell wall biosynthesis